MFAHAIWNFRLRIYGISWRSTPSKKQAFNFLVSPFLISRIQRLRNMKIQKTKKIEHISNFRIFVYLKFLTFNKQTKLQFFGFTTLKFKLVVKTKQVNWRFICYEYQAYYYCVVRSLTSRYCLVLCSLTLKGWSRTRLSKMFELVAEVSPQKSHQDAFSCRSMLKLWYATCLNSSWREIPMEEWRETCKYSAPIQVKCLS